MEIEDENDMEEEQTNELLESALRDYQKQEELKKKRIEEKRKIKERKKRNKEKWKIEEKWRQREKENDRFSYGVVCCLFVIIIGLILFFVVYSIGGWQVIDQFMQIFGKYF